MQQVYTEIFERGGMKMAEYISREAVLKAFKLIAKNPNKDYQRGMQDAIDCLVPEVIADIPTVDVQPIKHGRWVVDEHGYLRCDNCGEVCLRNDIGIYVKSWYCPECGADMRGDENG
jgi:rubredoxin